jgi:formylglycine-generating enzyme required for sulfatase activity
VDKSLPNSLGLFEVGGNVSEWCQDEWPGVAGHRVIRGGSWLIFERERLLTSARDHAAADSSRADLGFRLVLDLGAP